MELLNKGPRAKETTEMTPVASPFVVCWHQNRHFIPSNQPTHHLKVGPVAKGVKPSLEELRTQAATIDDDDAPSEDSQRGKVTCSHLEESIIVKIIVAYQVYHQTLST